MTTQSDGLPLAGVRVVEWVAGPMRMTGRLLADLGAEVIHFAGGSARSGGWRETVVDGVNLDALALGRGKVIRTSDPLTEAGRSEFLAALADCDILLEDSLALFGEDFAPEALARRYPGLIHLTISDFGRTGPFAGWIASDPVLHALSGSLSRSGIPGREPLVPPGTIASSCAATQAALAALLALVGRLDHGGGDWIDFAVLDAVTLALDPGFGVMGSAAGGARTSDSQRDRPDVRYRYPIIACADGHVRLCLLSPRQWRGMFTWMGSPPEFSDPSYETLSVRFTSTTLLPAISAFFAGRTRDEIERDGQAYGVPVARVRSLEEAIATDQNEARAVFAIEPSATTVPVRLPQAPFEIDGRRPRDFGRDATPALPRVTASSHAEPRLPLTGLRVLDLGVIVVGAETGRLLADAGADVIKVENAAFADGLRQTMDGSAVSASFAVGNRNKRSLAIDLRDEHGRSLFLEMVRSADIMLSNFKPGTLESLGLTWPVLSAANPRLVAVDNSAFGPTGPGRGHLGYGPLVRAATGLTAAWAYAGEDEAFCDAMTVYPDHVAGRMGAIAALALLVRLRRTGRGGTASLAQSEMILDHLAVQIAAAEQAAAGHPAVFTDDLGPWGVFPCAGDDEWCAVTVADENQSARLSKVLGVTGDPALLELVLVGWLSSRGPIEAMTLLQQAGVPAGAMLRVPELPEFEHFAAHNLYGVTTHPLLPEPMIQELRPFASRMMADPPIRPGPSLGEHSGAVLRDWLSLSDVQLSDLIASGVVGTSS